MLALITVDTAADVFDTSDRRTSLREAIFAANTVTGIDEIVFAGTDFNFDATITLQQGELRVTEPLTITGPSGSALTIDGRNESRIINFEGGGLLTLSRLVLNRGRVTVDNPTEPPQSSLSTLGNGGALRAAVGNVALNEVTVLNSSVAGANAVGGGVFVRGSEFQISFTVTNSRFEGNRAEGSDGEGGSIAVWGIANIENTQVSRSRASRGGGIASAHWITLTASTLDDNTAFDDVLGAGGGLYSTGYTTIVNCTISGNAAQATGPNARAQGGGVFASYVQIEYSTLTANTVSSLGVGAESRGGGLYGAGYASLLSSIAAGNFSTDHEADVHFTIPSSIYASLVGDGRGTLRPEAPLGAANAEYSLIGGTKYGLIDPRLGPLANNGGRTQTHALLFGSPAIGSGDSNLNGGPLAFDQRGIGFPRIAGARIDMGAIESDVRSWIVDTLVDEDDGDFGTGDLSLREALKQAIFSAGEDLIEFAPSFYTFGRKTISLTRGPLTAGLGVDIRGPGAQKLTIDASGNDLTPTVDDGQGSSVLVFVGTGGSEALLSGVTITGGDSVEVGGIVAAGETTLTDVTIVDNYGQGQAGGLSGALLTIRASRIAENRSERGTAGIRAVDLTLERSVTSDNRITATSGIGGISISRDAVIVESEISNNVAPRGTGGIGIGTSAGNGGSFFMADTLVSGNQGWTGGLFLGASFEIVGSSIINNVGAEFGGGLDVHSAGVIESSTISGNSSRNSGGAFWTRSGSPPVTLRHSTVVNNKADSDGDGVGVGGGFFQVRPILDHTIVANQGMDFAWSTGSGTVTAEHSLISNLAGTNLAEAPIGSPDAHGNLIGGPVYGIIDAELGSLTENGVAALPTGGKLLTHLPLAGSPAINAGNAALESGVGDTPEFDQRGAPFSRVFGGRIDIGAVEATGPLYQVDTLVDESDGDYSRGDLSLREALELANLLPGDEVIVFDPALFASGPATILLTRGELSVKDSVAIRGPQGGLLTIDASGNDATPEVNDGSGTRALNIDDGTTSRQLQVSISDLKFTGGDLNGSGGAISSREGLEMVRVVVVGNFADGSGGGLWATARNGASIVLVDCDFIGNIADATVANGGGAYLSNLGDGKISITGCEFESNSTLPTSGSGGGAYVQHSGLGEAIVEGNVFRANTLIGTSVTGAGLAFVRATAGTSLIRDNGFVGNKLAGTSAIGIGAHVRAEAAATILVESNEVRDNVKANTRNAVGGIGVTTTAGGVVRVTNNVVTGNFVGISVASGGHAEVSDNLVTDNIASGMSLSGTGGGSVDAYRNTVLRNQAESAGAGLVLNVQNNGRVEVRETTIDSNVSRRGFGGGVYAFATTGGTIVVSSSTISRNTSQLATNGGNGGGAYLRNDGGSIQFDQVTISGNTAAGFGGGVAIQSAVMGRLSISRSTIVGNTSGNAGGGVHVTQGSAVIDHTIVAGNIDLSNTAPDIAAAASVPASAVSPRFSLVSTAAGSPFSESPAGGPDANGNRIGGPVNGVIDPLLGPLADNGGPALPGGAKLLTHAPLAASLAIDAGNPTDTAPAVQAAGTATINTQAKGSLTVGLLATGSVTVASEAAGTITLSGQTFNLVARDGGSAAGAEGNSVAVLSVTFGAGSASSSYNASSNTLVVGVTQASGVARILDIVAAINTGPDFSASIGDAMGSTTVNTAQAAAATFNLTGGGQTITLTARPGGNAVGLEGNEADNLVIIFGAPTATSSYNASTNTLSVSITQPSGFATVANVVAAINNGSAFSATAAVGAGRLSTGDAASAAFALTGGASTSITLTALAGGNAKNAEGNQARSLSVAFGAGLAAASYNASINRLIVSVTQPSGVATLQNIVDAINSGTDFIASVLPADASRLFPTGALAMSVIALTGGSSNLINLLAVAGGLTDGVEGNDVAKLQITFGAASAGSSYNATTNTLHVDVTQASDVAIINNVINAINAGTDFIAALAAGANALQALVTGDDANTDFALTGGADENTSGAAVPEFDQRGAPYARLTGSRTDMGAVESQAAGGALSGDFDLDGHANGNDFLAWQRGLGRTGVVTIRHGDATADGDVDGNDLAVWKARAQEEEFSSLLLAVSQRGEDRDDVASTTLPAVVAQVGVGNPSPGTSLRGRGIDAADAVFAAGNFSALFAVSESPSAARGKWRPLRRV